MDNTVATAIVFAMAASVPVAMIVGNYLRRQRQTTTRPATPADSDINAINKGICPDCGETGTLLAGPSGGMAQNVACNSCLMEFNVGFGFGTGAFMVDRTGKMTESRAKVFGIDSDEYHMITGAMNHG